MNAHLYVLNNSQQDRTIIYARNPDHIIELVKYYRDERLSEEDKNRPDLLTWLRKIPSLEDILPIEEAGIGYQAGMINMGLEGELFEHIQLTDDFILNVNLESLPYLDVYRRTLPSGKRCQLYKWVCPGTIFQSQNFIPEDVMQAIVNCDLGPYFKKAKEILKDIKDVGDGHPNIHVGFREVQTDLSSN